MTNGFPLRRVRVYELTTATASISMMKSGPARRVDGRASQGGHAEITHSDIATLLEFVEIGDEGISLHTSDQVAPAALRHRILASEGQADVISELRGGIAHWFGASCYRALERPKIWSAQHH